MTVDQWMANYAQMPTNHLRKPTPQAQRFYDWLVAFNQLVAQRWPGATLLDLAERPYEDWCHDYNWTPQQAIDEVVRDQGHELDAQFSNVD